VCITIKSTIRSVSSVTKNPESQVVAFFDIDEFIRNRDACFSFCLLNSLRPLRWTICLSTTSGAGVTQERCRRVDDMWQVMMERRGEGCAGRKKMMNRQNSCNLNINGWKFEQCDAWHEWPMIMFNYLALHDMFSNMNSFSNSHKWRDPVSLTLDAAGGTVLLPGRQELGQLRKLQK